MCISDTVLKVITTIVHLSSDCQNQALLDIYLPHLEQLLKTVMGVLAVDQVGLLPVLLLGCDRIYAITDVTEALKCWEPEPVEYMRDLFSILFRYMFAFLVIVS